uniref:ATP-dependent zinc metalloprotease FTSH 12, chloroplastic n=1 Tax=Tanacetum cinerariifolium TaxID=118510 RepID=A0A6L2MEA4_TANCI|nr:ATP-dependent zinc metalloprotease FTSH 12, chloroplastic [Tanacetum cinerariifolium]
MVRSGPGRSDPGRSSVQSGPTRHNLRVFGKIGPDRTEDRTGPKPRTEDRTEIRPVESGSVRFSDYKILTNRLDGLDLEFVQAGRIDRRLHIGLPDAKQRVQISGVHSTGKQLAEDVEFENALAFIFVDEIGAIPGRHARKDPRRRSIFDALIAQLDGEKEKTGVARFSMRQAVIFFCATNRPDELDLEFVQAGRINRRLHIGLPDAKRRVRRGHTKIYQKDIIDVLDKQLLEGMVVLLTEEEQQKCEKRVFLDLTGMYFLNCYPMARRRRRLLQINRHVLFPRMKPFFVCLIIDDKNKVLRFGAAFWFCVLLIEDSSCVLSKEDSASFKTWLRFGSGFGCVLSRRLPAFYLKTSAFCLKTGLRFVSRPPAFCLKTNCVLSPDYIQCAGSDTRPPMLDRTDFASWQQRIRLYCRGKENGVNILKSIDEGPYQMGIVWEPLAEGTEGAPHLGSELTKEDQESQMYDDFEHFRQHKGESIHDYYVRFAKLINDMRNIKMTMSRMQLNSKFVNMLPEWGRFVTSVKLNRGLRDSNYDKLYAYLKQPETHAKENKMMLERFSQNTVDPLALMLNVSNQQRYSPSSSTLSFTQGRQIRGQRMNPWGRGVAGYGRGVQNIVGNVNPGQARPVKCYNCNGTRHIARNCTQPKRPQNSEYYKDKMLLMQAQENGAPTAGTMFMANLSSAYPVTDEAGPSYDLDILSEVQDHDHYQDVVCAHHKEHEMYDNVQLNHDVDTYVDHTSDSNMIPYDQYVKDNAMPVVYSDVSSVPNDDFMMIYNDMCEPHAQSISNQSRNIVVKNLLTAELTTYKEQVELCKYKGESIHDYYVRFAKLINDRRNIKITMSRMQLNSKFVNMLPEWGRFVTSVKLNKGLRDSNYDQLYAYLKQHETHAKENKMTLERFSQNTVDPLALMSNVSNQQRYSPSSSTLSFTQGQQNRGQGMNPPGGGVAGYGRGVNPGQARPVKCYNCNEDTLEIAEITRKKMNDKMKDPEYVTRKVKIAPHDYSKENFLATFIPQKQVTPEQIFWSQDLIKLKSEALKE